MTITNEDWAELARVKLYETPKSMLIDLYYRRSHNLHTLAKTLHVPAREIKAKLIELDLPIRDHEKGGDEPGPNG